MKRELEQAFDPVRAEEALKRKTRQRVLNEMERRSRPRRVGRRAILAGALCALAVAAVSGYRFCFTATTVISVDVNPSVELAVNRLDRVIGVEGRNADGAALAEGLDVLFLPYGQALEAVLENETITGCLRAGEVLSIAVVQSDPAQGAEILDYVSACTAGRENISCCGVAREEVAQAHEVGLSYGKYRMFLQLQDCGAACTPEQVADMTMRELCDWLDRCGSGREEAETSEANAGGGHGGYHHGREDGC